MENDLPPVSFENSSQKNKPVSTVGALTQLAIGAVFFGLDELEKYISKEDEQTTREEFIQPDAATYQLGTDLELAGVQDEKSGMTSFPVKSEATIYYTSREYERERDINYTLVGMFLSTTSHIRRIALSLDRTSRKFANSTTTVVSPVTNSKLLNPPRSVFNKLVNRGEIKVEEWNSLGRQEVDRGQKLLTTVTYAGVNASVDYVADQPKLTELVNKQSLTHAGAILLFFREILVSLDLLFEGLLRAILHLTPRSEIPGPDREIRIKAVSGLLSDNQPADVDSPHSMAGYYAGFASRFVHLVVDFIVILGAEIFLEFLYTSLSKLMEFFSSILSKFMPGLASLLAQSREFSPQTAVIVFTVTFVIYNIICWITLGATIGDSLVGIRLVNHNAKLIGGIRGFLRTTVGYSISFLLLFFGFWMVLWTNKRMSLHDFIFRTGKYYSWDAHPSKSLLMSPLKKLMPESHSN